MGQSWAVCPVAVSTPGAVKEAGLDPGSWSWGRGPEAGRCWRRALQRARLLSWTPLEPACKRPCLAQTCDSKGPLAAPGSVGEGGTKVAAEKPVGDLSLLSRPQGIVLLHGSGSRRWRKV